MGIAFAIAMSLIDLIPAAILLAASAILLRHLQNGAAMLMLIGAAGAIVVRFASVLRMILLSARTGPSGLQMLLGYTISIGYVVAGLLFALGLLGLARTLAGDSSLATDESPATS